MSKPVKERFAYVIVDKDDELVPNADGREIWCSRIGPVQTIKAQSDYYGQTWQQVAEKHGWRIVPCKLVPVEETDAA